MTFNVFGYGSLMWRPGFPHLSAEPAVLVGRHRRLCVFSWHHRGTRERPGLVLGLDRGGACRGLVFRVDPAERETVLSYLRAREQVTSVYLEKVVPVRLLDGTILSAVAYVVDRRHPQYAGALDLSVQFETVRGAAGASGPNPEYVIATAAHLEEIGMPDASLSALARLLEAEAVPGRLAAGG